MPDIVLGALLALFSLIPTTALREGQCNPYWTASEAERMVREVQ